MKIKRAIPVANEKKYNYNRISFFSNLYANNADPSEPGKTRILPLIIIEQATSANSPGSV
jgi:hypothetical protein